MLNISTVKLIKNNYPDKIRIITKQEGYRYKVDGYFVMPDGVLRHIFTSKALFQSHGQAKLYAEVECQTYVDDKKLMEIEESIL